MQRWPLLFSIAVAECAQAAEHPSSGLADAASADPAPDAGASDAGGAATTTNGVAASSSSYRLGTSTAMISVLVALVNRATDSEPANACTTVTQGPCVLTTCNYPSDASESMTPASVGPITLAGAEAPVTIAPQPGGTYATFSDTTRLLWTGGESLTFSAPGGDLPGFEQALVAPSTVTVTQPALVQGRTTASRGSDLAVAWTGTSAGALMLELSAPQTATEPLVDAKCTFDAAADRGVIPAALWSAIPVASLVVTVSTQTTASQVVAGMPFSALAFTTALAPDGTQLQGWVDLHGWP